MRAELPHIISTAERLLDAGEPAVLSTLFSSSGSSYRLLGAMMVSGPPGITAGGISGGCLEEYVARHARSLTQHRAAAVISFDTDRDADDAKPVLGCGGAIEVLVERLTAEHLTFLRTLAAAHDRDETSVHWIELQSNGDGVMTVTRHSCRPNFATDTMVGQVTRDRRSRTFVLSDDRSVLAHFVPAMTRLVAFGAGDDVRPLVTIAHSLGWHTTVIDRRSRLASESRFPDADQPIATDWQAAVGQVTFTPRTAVVLMTHSLPDDVEILPLIASAPVGYLGSLGPAHRRQWLLDLVPPEIAMRLNDDFRSPIGLNLGDRSAAGIAVAVVAEILAQLNDRDATSFSDVAMGSVNTARPMESIDA